MGIVKQIYIRFKYVYNVLFWKSLYEKNLYKRFMHDWDNKILVDYPLDENSVVFDVGWYIWVFSDKIISKYNPKIYIFEPIKKYFTILIQKYKNNPNVKVFHFWLGNKNKEVLINVDWERSSVLEWDNKNTERIIINNFSEIFNQENMKNIDLMSINIEWWEYELLNNIIENGLIYKIEFLQIQFHDFIPNAFSLRKELLDKIIKTHEVLYSFPFVREGFKKKTT